MMRKVRIEVREVEAVKKRQTEEVNSMKETEMEKVRKERRALEQRERNLKMVSNTSKRERDELDRAQKDLARL